MKRFDWNPEKNEWLRKVQAVTFEEVVFHIQRGGLLDILEHPNPGKFPGQKIFVVNVEDYACLIPFVETEDTIFLNTIIPSRRMTKYYLGGHKK